MPLFPIHAALMIAGYLLVFAALLIAATQRRKRWWLRIHRSAGLAGASLMLLGAMTAIAAVASAADGHHLRTPHTWLGVLTVSTAVIAPVLGLLQFRIPTKAGTIRPLHRLFGRILNLVAPIAIMLGLRVAGIL